MSLKRIICILVPSFIALIIFYLCCLITGDELPALEIVLPFNIQIDKLVHFLMYLGLSGATAFTYIYLKKGAVKINKLIVFAFILPILYGGLIEILQEQYFPPRNGDWFDFFADALGSIVALPFALWFRHFLLKLKKKK